MVGVIVNLALFFAWHVFWPAASSSTTVDWPAVALTTLATICIFRYKVGVIPVILACGILGMGWKLLG